MRNFMCELVDNCKINIRRKKDFKLIANYILSKKEIEMIKIKYGIDEVEEILDFIKSYENYQERKKLIDEDIKELFEDDEEYDE